MKEAPIRFEPMHVPESLPAFHIDTLLELPISSSEEFRADRNWLMRCRGRVGKTNLLS